MNSKLLIFIIIFLLLINFAFAGTQKALYSDKINDRSSIKVGDQNLSIVISSDAVSASYGSHNFLAREGKCDNDGTFTFCVSEIKDEFYAIVSLAIDVSDIKLSKTRIDTNPEIGVGEVVVIKVVVSNDGTANGGFFLEDDFSGFELLDLSSNCYVEKDKIKMNYTIRYDSSIDCTYRLKALKDGSHDLKAEIKYFDGYEDKTSSDTLDVDVGKNNLDVVLQTNKINYKFAENGWLNISIKNNFREKITIDKFDINFPRLNIINTDSKLKSGDHVLSSNGFELDRDEERFFKMSFNVTTLNNEVNVIVHYTGPGKRDAITKKIKFDISDAGPKVLLERLDNRVKIHIQNSADIPLANINIKMRSNYKNLNVPKNIPILMPKEERILEFELDEIPDYNVKYPIFVHGDYQTDYGEKLSFSRTLELNFFTKQQVLESGVDTLTNSSSSQSVEYVGDTGFSVSKPIKIIGMILLTLIIIVFIIYFLLIFKKRYNMKKEFSEKMKDVKL